MTSHPTDSGTDQQDGQDMAMPVGPGCQPTASAPDGSSQGGIPSAVWRLLPKARLFYVRRRHTRIVSLGHRRIWWAKFRNANAMFVWLGPLEIGWRMPWIERSARSLYPHLFARSRGAASLTQGDGMERVRELEQEVSTLRMLLVRYGDRIRMANASAWQQQIDAAFEGRCLKCGGTHTGSSCSGPPAPSKPLPWDMIA